MDMSGDRLIEAPKDKVWAALNDPQILQACLPGCESLEKLSDTSFKAIAAVSLGPITTRFNGTVLLSDLNPPNGYTISAEGQGGVAGAATGGGKVGLQDEPGGTRLSYQLTGHIAGQIAELEAGPIHAQAKQYAEAFFSKFAAIVAPHAVPAPATPGGYHLAHEDHDHDPSNPHYFGLPIGVIIAATIATISVFLTLFKFFG